MFCPNCKDSIVFADPVYFVKKVLARYRPVAENYLKR